MSERSDSIRAKLAALTVGEARAAVGRIMRKLLRDRVYEYARQHSIVDFNDPVLVEDSHRNWRQSLISAASSHAVNLQAATTIEDVLAVFDSIAVYIE